MRDSNVSAPTRSARMSNAPRSFRVPAWTASPVDFTTGIGSPETIDSSTLLVPSITRPSTGMRVPGRTRKRSPTATAASGMSVSSPSSVTRTAVTGERFMSAFKASPVRPRALNSSHWPSRTSVTMVAADSKYTGDSACAPRKVLGTDQGHSSAHRLAA